MNITFETWFSERSLVESGAVEATLADLRARDMAFDDGGAVWLRSTTYGDDKDRVLVKSDGEFTYLLPDIAYHRDKFERGFDLLINVWGADHHGYVARMKAAMQLLGHDPDELEVAIVQLVNLMKGGEPVKLSKRSGDIIELGDVFDEVGPDPARLTYLLQSIDTPQTFDIDVVTSEGNDNPVYYVQMAHARIRSIKKVAGERGIERVPFAAVDRSLLRHERELEVLRELSLLPEVLATAAADRAPHRIAAWVRELAGAVHGFYHDCHVMGDGVSAELTQARLWLVEASEIGLSIGLDLLGVDAPESM
jgi:arginyl-tRNA synthetase